MAKETICLVRRQSAALQVEMTDNGEPGSIDQIGITLYSKEGGLWFSSNWDGVRTQQQTLAGDNLKVSGGTTSGPRSKTARLEAEQPLGQSLSVGAFPNPVINRLTIALGYYPAAAITATRIQDAQGNQQLVNTHRVVRENRLEMDVRSLTPSLYRVRLEGAGLSLSWQPGPAALPIVLSVSCHQVIFQWRTPKLAAACG